MQSVPEVILLPVLLRMSTAFAILTPSNAGNKDASNRIWFGELLLGTVDELGELREIAIAEFKVLVVMAKCVTAVPEAIGKIYDCAFASE
jgi:hypothetical protein